MAPGSGDGGRRGRSFHERWGPGRCKSRSINQRGEGNVTVRVAFSGALAGTSLQLLGGSAEQALPSVGEVGILS